MQLMGDALTVLGSRIGVGWDPRNRTAFLIRHGEFPNIIFKDTKSQGFPIQIHAGVKVYGKTFMLPLSKGGEPFEFLDQETTVTTMSLSGIAPYSGLHVKLTVRIPFKPRDSQFSVTPKVFFELEVDRLSSSYRWASYAEEEIIVWTLFLVFSGEGLEFHSTENTIHVHFVSRFIGGTRDHEEKHYDSLHCDDRIPIIAGNLSESIVYANFSLKKGQQGPSIALEWCCYDEPVLKVFGKKCPFKYTEQFRSVYEVVHWAVSNLDKVKENSSKVDALMGVDSLGEAVKKFVAYALHAWLANTWWVIGKDSQDWFIVWEGSCYFHSTVDVEYTQGPFYLTVWPELLEWNEESPY